MNDYNPFPLSGYHGPELFCDRDTETKKLITHVKNGINTTLISTRRMGKTGLLLHTFHTLQNSRGIACIYVDIYGTQNLKDFTNSLGTAILRAFPEKKSLGKKFMEFLKGLRPNISFDPLSGEPEIKIEYSGPEAAEHSLASLFGFLDKQGITIVIALDEFQQVTQYPEKNTEAILRSIIQHLKNVRFIFSGSSQHILNEIFNSAKRPFFSSTQVIFLNEIREDIYAQFIEKIFAREKRKIQKDALAEILRWTRLHTYYTQTLCNRLYYSGYKTISKNEVLRECQSLLKDQESVFYQYRSLLTTIQWQLLKSIAHEEKVYHPTSKGFVTKYDVGTQANVQRALEALVNKEMVYRGRDEKGNFFRVSDCFLARWLERQG
jgi:uncharacterized protein